MIKSKTQQLTYLNVPADRFEYRLTPHATRRVVVHVWSAKAIGQNVEHEAGTIELRLMVGKNYKSKTLAHAVLAPGATAEQIEADAAALLNATIVQDA